MRKELARRIEAALEDMATQPCGGSKTFRLAYRLSSRGSSALAQGVASELCRLWREISVLDRREFTIHAKPEDH